MSDATLVVRADEARSFTMGRSFVGLPKEEIERHFATLEVVTTGVAHADRDVVYRTLMMCVVAHHNYRWLMCGALAATPKQRTLLSSHLAPHDGVLFLDDGWCSAAKKLVEEELIVHDEPVVRLAGLLDVRAPGEDSPLHVVCVAKLRGPEVESRDRRVGHLELMGPGELSALRSELDPRGRVIVDNLHAL